MSINQKSVQLISISDKSFQTSYYCKDGGTDGIFTFFPKDLNLVVNFLTLCVKLPKQIMILQSDIVLLQEV